MCPALVLNRVQVYQLQVGLVNECRCIERMAAPLVQQSAMCHLPQFVIDDGEEPIECLTVALRARGKELSAPGFLAHDKDTSLLSNLDHT